MTEAWPDLAGRLSGGRHFLPVRVYYEDTDVGGVVYHANYLRYCERGRTDLLRMLGIRQSALEDLGFVVRRMECEFLRPGRLDDLLVVETSCSAVMGARLTLQQQVLRSGEVLFSAAVTVALIDGRGRPRRLPADMLARLKSLAESNL
ncbi:MAG: tol-pal system-associated acyl-CoA thioesterase [Alphaproteobacteria bacterium]|nr:tol-pal system-associated acyl-CoA thioesterase [Alphaproteobacteria bacterium]